MYRYLYRGTGTCLCIHSCLIRYPCLIPLLGCAHRHTVGFWYAYEVPGLFIMESRVAFNYIHSKQKPLNCWACLHTTTIVDYIRICNWRKGIYSSTHIYIGIVSRNHLTTSVSTTTVNGTGLQNCVFYFASCANHCMLAYGHKYLLSFIEFNSIGNTFSTESYF